MNDHRENKADCFSAESPSDSSFEDPGAEQHLLRKCDICVVPVLFVLYAVSFLDRINIGNARIQGLEPELRMKGNDYNVALLIFFVPYILLEIPSNMVLKNVKPSTWLSFMMFSCGKQHGVPYLNRMMMLKEILIVRVRFIGIATMCQGLTRSYAGLVICRALIGVFEAGFFPGKLKPACCPQLPSECEHGYY